MSLAVAFFFISILGAALLVGYRFMRPSFSTWPLFYQMLVKWMGITIICGGYSFFLGIMLSGLRFIPMIAAMMVTAAALAFVESRGAMGGIKMRFPLLKRAMTYGTHFRISWALLYPVGLVLSNFIFGTKSWLSFLSMFSAMMDVWIGIFVTELFKIIGFNIEKLNGGARVAPGALYPEWVAQLGIFGISLTTAAIHVMILVVITLLIWAGLSAFYSLRQKKTS